MSNTKDMSDVVQKSRKFKKTSEKRNRSVLAPSSTVLNNNFKEELAFHQSEDFPVRPILQSKDELNQAIHESEKEIEFLNTVLLQFLDINELMKIKMSSHYDESTRSWVVPSFVVQQKKTVLPKLHRSQMREIIQNELKQKKLALKFAPTPEFACKTIEEDDMLKRAYQATSNAVEFENRPATSLAKQRKRPHGTRVMENETEVRKSSPIKKKTIDARLMYGFYE